uniref:Uncharacterized protein n=1 Tax=Zea mays TaxID=4577 RepID=A0A804RB60_MAIZE
MCWPPPSSAAQDELFGEHPGPITTSSSSSSQKNLCLIEFYTSSWKRKPHQVIISRNDVSESQFNLVLNIELQQIIDGD